MLTVEEALARLLGSVVATQTETVALSEALGRVPSREPIVARHDVPPFANSAMDGFAVRAADGDAPRRLRGESRAGRAGAPGVEPGSAVRIATGAPMPPGADAVVPLEDASESAGVVQVAKAPPRSAHVRAAGHDVPAGSTLTLFAEPIAPAAIGLLAALGEATVEVRRRPRVAILSTGDELVPVGSALNDAQIHDANGPALAAAVREAGGEPLALQPARDEAVDVERRVREGIAGSDLLVVSGGVSVGGHDHVRGAIERLGTLEFWRIAVQPGKPLAFGRVSGRPVIGLPGNPVSALVTFELFVRPMLRAMLGLPGDGRLRLLARVDDELRKDPARRAYLRVRICREGGGHRAVSAGGQASSQLLPLASANALLIVPEGLPATVPGEAYTAILTGLVE